MQRVILELTESFVGKLTLTKRNRNRLPSLLWTSECEARTTGASKEYCRDNIHLWNCLRLKWLEKNKKSVFDVALRAWIPRISIAWPEMLFSCSYQRALQAILFYCVFLSFSRMLDSFILRRLYIRLYITAKNCMKRNGEVKSQSETAAPDATHFPRGYISHSQLVRRQFSYFILLVLQLWRGNCFVMTYTAVEYSGDVCS